jgi:hypothetical protein
LGLTGRAVKHAKNQHTVPCLYLREFAVEPSAKHPQIYALDKTNQGAHCTSIRNVAAEVHFYERGDTGIEKGLQRFEDLFVGPYRRLLTVDKPSDLTQDEIAAVVGFVTVQSMRTREVRESAKSIDGQLSALLKAEGVEDSAFGSISDDDIRQIQINALLRNGPRFAGHIARLKWVLTINGTTMPYWTSDNPITRYNPHPDDLKASLGLGDCGIQVFFPLSPTRSLCLCDPEEYAALPEVWTTNDIQNIWFENALQVRAATRFVFANAEDFSLAKTILARYPDCADPARPRVRVR